MSFIKKALKVVAVVGAIALAIPSGGTSLLAATLGVSAVAATAIAGGLMVASALLNKPKIPSVSQAALSRLNVSIDPRTPRKLVFGNTAMGCDLRDMEYTGTDNMYVHYFIVVAAHEVAGFNSIYLDDKLAWNGTAVQAPFTNYLTVAVRTLGSAGNAINLSPRMGSSRRYTGLAYVHLRFRRTGINDKATSPFSGSIPSRITTIGSGIKCYDPRQDSTVLGGSGPMRADNQATWTYGTHARNPACQLLTYLLGWKINGRLSVGKGLPPARIDMGSFMTCANACDVPIALAAGGTQPRYRSDGMFSEADGMEAVIEAFKATMNAELDDSGGQLALRMLLNDLDDPIAHFGPDQIISGITWRTVTEISDRTNRIAGQYVDPRPLSLYQLIDYPEVMVPSVDGIERTLPRSYPMVQDPAQAQRTAKEVLQRQLYGGLLEMTVDHTGWRVQKYDIVTVTHPPLGFYNKLFRVADISVGLHGQVPLVLREENAAIYAWDRDERPAVQPVAPTTYDYSNNPILMGIEEAGTDVIWTKSATTPPTPAAGAGVPVGWYGSSADLPAGDVPIWISLGSRGTDGVFSWQAPIQSATDIRFWEAVDAGGEIKPDKVVTDSISPGAVTTPKIDNLAITTAKIGAAAVTTAKIGDLQVDTIKIANNAVTLPIVTTAGDVTAPATGVETTIIETSVINIAEAPATASAMIAFYGTMECGSAFATEADSTALIRVYIDRQIGAGWQLIGTQNMGINTLDARSYFWLPAAMTSLANNVDDIALKVTGTSVPGPQPGSTARRAFRFKNPSLSVQGIRK